MHINFIVEYYYFLCLQSYLVLLYNCYNIVILFFYFVFVFLFLLFVFNFLRFCCPRVLFYPGDVYVRT